MHARARVYACTHTHTHVFIYLSDSVYACVSESGCAHGGQGSTLDSSSDIYTLFLRQGLSLGLELIHQPQAVTSETLGPASPALDHKCALSHPAFTRVLGTALSFPHVQDSILLLVVPPPPRLCLPSSSPSLLDASETCFVPPGSLLIPHCFCLLIRALYLRPGSC